VTAREPDWTEGVPRIVVSRCRTCGNRWYLRRSRGPSCGSAEVGGHVSGGTGTVSACTVLHHVPAAPFGVCLVALDEGVTVMTRCDTAVRIGSRVSIGFVDGVPHAAEVR
jgi:uncharacterized OB-fold protein